MIDILLVDDHELIRVGIRSLLKDIKGIRVSAEAESGEEAIEKVKKRRPDVVLMDVSMPGIGGLEATRRIHRIEPTLPIVVITVMTEEPYPSKLMEAGATGFLSKGSSVKELVEAIEEVHAGRRYISPSVAKHLVLNMLDGSGGKDESPFQQLSSRELQVLLMLVEGQKVQQISEVLHLSPKTIATYRYRIFDKIGVRNDAALTRLAMRYNLIQGGTQEA